MFDFALVGISIGFAGIGFRVIMSRVLLPQERAYEATRLEFDFAIAGTALGLRPPRCISVSRCWQPS